jgi:hypothetical protein
MNSLRSFADVYLSITKRLSSGLTSGRYRPSGTYDVIENKARGGSNPNVAPGRIPTLIILPAALQ